jgi:hypothetical protein
MKQMILLVFFGATALAQEVHFDYDRSANFSSYRTYQWIDQTVQSGDQLLDKDIKRAVDAQLAGKGLRRVDTGGDLLIGYHGAVSQEKRYDRLGWGPGPWGTTSVTTSTIQIGTLVVEFFDASAKQLIWRGSVSKTLSIKNDPDKNYRNLEKAMAKLFRKYPPGAAKS